MWAWDMFKQSHGTPKNRNRLHYLEMKGFNDRIAVNITHAVGTMWCAYAFMVLAILGFPALSALLGTYVAIYVVWISQTFLQLVFLPILSVGQGVLGQKQELQNDESFHIAQNNEHDLGQIMLHLTVINGQLVELLEAKNK